MFWIVGFSSTRAAAFNDGTNGELTFSTTFSATLVFLADSGAAAADFDTTIGAFATTGADVLATTGADLAATGAGFATTTGYALATATGVTGAAT